MTSPSIVRIAKPEDQVEIWRLLKLGFEENGKFSPSSQKASYFMERALFPERIHPADTGPRGVIGVIGPTGALEAMALLVIGSYWYTDDRIIEELLVYVDPAHRKSRHAVAIINWMKLQSDITGIPLLTGVISSIKTEAKCDLYRRLLPKAGEFFLYGVGRPSAILASSISSAIAHG